MEIESKRNKYETRSGTKRADADENRDLFNYHGRTRTFGYFQIQEKLNQHDTLLQMHSKDLDQNSEFRIKYPRGELGQSSGEIRAFHVSGAYGRTNYKDGRPYGKHDVK